jgi:hypothetical protein
MMASEEQGPSSTLNFDTALNRPLKLECNKCKHPTNHKILRSVEDIWDTDFGLAGKEEHLIVQCMGCDFISYCKQYSDNETFEETINPDGKRDRKYIILSEQYPVVKAVFSTPIPFKSIPKDVQTTYHETHKALIQGSDKLGGVGIRMIVELVCADNGITKGKLWHKINTLHNQGVVTEKMRDLLHNVRLFGNKQAHETGSPDVHMLTEAWGAVNTFLSSLYGTNDANEKLNFLKTKN